MVASESDIFQIKNFGQRSSIFDKKKLKYKLFGHRSSIEQLTPATASELLRLVGNDERSGSRPIQLTAKLPAQSRGAQKAGKSALNFFLQFPKKYIKWPPTLPLPRSPKGKNFNLVLF